MFHKNLYIHFLRYQNNATEALKFFNLARKDGLWYDKFISFKINNDNLLVIKLLFSKMMKG